MAPSQKGKKIVPGTRVVSLHEMAKPALLLVPVLLLLLQVTMQNGSVLNAVLHGRMMEMIGGSFMIAVTSSITFNAAEFSIVAKITILLILSTRHLLVMHAKLIE